MEEGTYDPSQLPELLQQYYVWLFPFDKYYEWLSYGEGGSDHWYSYRSLSICLWRKKHSIDAEPEPALFQ